MRIAFFACLLVACSGSSRTLDIDATDAPDRTDASAVDAAMHDVSTVDTSITLGTEGGTPDASPPSDAIAAPPDGAIDPCSPGAAPPTGDQIRTIESAGGTRWYYLHIPTSYDGSARELVLNFHGFTSDPFQQALLSEMNPVADTRGFIVAYPAGIDESWNAGLCCGDSAWISHVDDVQFVRDAIDAIAREYCIDTHRVYATGMSNGGFLSHALACELSDRIAAVAPVAGVLAIPSCTPTRNVPVMHFHGTADPLVPYYGGSLLGFPSVPVTYAGWTLREGCLGAESTFYSNGDSTCVEHAGCGAGSEVMLCTVQGGGHTWPGGFPIPPLGYTTTDMNATSMMLDFLTDIRFPSAMDVRSDFEAGNIEVLDVGEGGASLAIRSDSNADFRQWFHFRVEGAKRRRCELSIVNAGEATYPDAWDGYRACATYDDKKWFRVPTEFDGERLIIDHTPEHDAIRYAYFAPYELERHGQLLERVARSKHARFETIARSVQGRDVQMVVVGEPSDARRNVWITARQHPGETMAEWFMEGAIERLLTRADPVTRALLEQCAFYLVPNMNPDGSVLGNLRANAAGMNLNRAWLEPDDEASPEVLGVRDVMHSVGVDLFLDVHGDERNPYCFLAGCEGNPSYSERIRALENEFEQSLVAFDDDFQDEYGYERDEPGGGDLRTAGNYVGERFDCLSFTVEMPFKDAANHPDPARGWTPERARRLGRCALESVLVCAGSVR